MAFIIVISGCLVYVNEMNVKVFLREGKIIPNLQIKN